MTWRWYSKLRVKGQTIGMTGDLYFVETSSGIARAGFELSIQPKILGFHLPGVVMYRQAPSNSDLYSAKDQKQGLCILGKHPARGPG